MKRLHLIAFLVIVLLTAARPLFGQQPPQRYGAGGLSRALANALYCQLAGCTMTGAWLGTTIQTSGNVGLGIAPSGTTGQALYVQSNGNYVTSILAGNTNAGAAAAVDLQLQADTARVDLFANATGVTTSRWGQAVGGYNELLAITGNGLEIGTITATPVRIGTNNVTAFTINGTTQAITQTSTTLTGISLASGSIYRVTSDFTLAGNTSLQTITGLSWILPANTAANYPFSCEILYFQATAAVADQFGIQAASLAPTNIMAKADVNISASTFTAANLPTLTTTTATAIVTFTPSAITTIWNARIAGMIENPSGVANTINVMAQTSNAADLVTVKRGSYCVVGF